MSTIFLLYRGRYTVSGKNRNNLENINDLSQIIDTIYNLISGKQIKEILNL